MVIARMVWTEILRKRVFWVTVAMTVVFLALYLYAVQRGGSATGPDPLTQYLHHALWLAMGLYMANLIVAYLAIFSAAGTISAELESGLLLAILPRPIRRWQVYLGKWLGYSVWSVLYAATVYWAVIAIVQHATALPLDAGSVLRAFAVFELVPITLVGLTVLGSLFLPTLSNGVMTTLLFGIGMVGGFVQRVAPGEAALNKVGLVTSLLIPTNADYYRMMYEVLGGSALPAIGSQFQEQMGPFGGGPVPSNLFLGYTVFYAFSCVAFGVWRFSRQDV
jgi:ABC-type transport system involved in multi-copper enzyme maturation permease subunit